MRCQCVPDAPRGRVLVRRVANGEEALAAALAFKPDLVLVDVMMPKVSGYDVLDILRNTQNRQS